MRHPDLKLFAADETPQLSDEQKERMLSMLISLFERAYLLLYDETMTSKQRRRWLSWEDYMRDWCRRADFRRLLPSLLKGEDPEFVTYIRSLEVQECGADATKFQSESLPPTAATDLVRIARGPLA